MQGTGPNSDHRFVDYYAAQSASDQTRRRFESTQRVLLGLCAELGISTQQLDVVDVCCGAGAHAIMWAQTGHRASH